MKKASEYPEHARECRQLALQMQAPEQRQQMLRMAEHWDNLAKDRIALTRKHPELAHDREQADWDDESRRASDQ